MAGRPVRALIFSAVAAAWLVGGCAETAAASSYVGVGDREAARALSVAMKQVGDPYVWAGQGPAAFDCSGLVIWSYEQVVPRFQMPDGRGGAITDATMDHLWTHATRHVPAREVRPGDIVFITSDPSRITHGGIVLSVSGSEVTFVNASSYYGEVTVDTWRLDQETRGQWIVGFGRLLVFGYPRPPLAPQRIGRTTTVMLDGRGSIRQRTSWIAAGYDSGTTAGTGSISDGPYLAVTVLDDERQSEVLVGLGRRSWRVGAGVRTWDGGLWDESYVPEGNEPYVLVAAEAPIAGVVAGAEVTYAESGWTFAARILRRLPVSGAFATLSAWDHRTSSEEPLEPVLALGVTLGGF